MIFFSEGRVTEVGESPVPLLCDNRARLWIEKDIVLIGNFKGLELIIGEGWVLAPDVSQAS